MSEILKKLGWSKHLTTDTGLKQTEIITREQVVDEIMEFVCEQGGEADIKSMQYWLASYFENLPKCPHCRRTEKCEGAPPEGCFKN